MTSKSEEKETVDNNSAAEEASETAESAGGVKNTKKKRRSAKDKGRNRSRSSAGKNGDGGEDGGASEAGLEKLNAELADALQKNIELTDKYMRLLAEFDNFKKRSLRDLERSIELQGEKLIMNVLPVLDDFERALVHGENENDPAKVLDGFSRVQQKFLQVLKGFDVEPFDSEGEDFDPERHDALMTRPAAEEADDDRILEEFEKGYLRGDKVIRHAKVVVGKVE